MAHIHITPSDLHRAKIEYKPGHPHSKIYDYTYGYSMNYYQPMIDYLDRRDSTKDSEKRNLQLPHLPWTNERYIQEFEPKKPIKLHNAERTNEIAIKSQNGARRNINNFDVKRSYFGAVATADATKLLRKLPKTSALDAVYKRDLGQTIQDIEDLEMETYYRYKEGERQMLEQEREFFPDGLKRSIKGKSANQIRNILVADSMRNIQEQSDSDARILRECYATARTRRAARSLSESGPRNFDDRNVSDIVQGKFSNSLQTMKKDINSYTDRTEQFLNDTRYRLKLIDCELREQEDYLKTRKAQRDKKLH